MSTVINVTTENFDEVVRNSTKPVVIDFWATWCGPCQNFGPVFDAASTKRDDVVFVKLNIEENREIAAEYGIRGIPYIALLEQGDIVAAKAGAMSSEVFENWLDSVVE